MTELSCDRCHAPMKRPKAKVVVALDGATRVPVDLCPTCSQAMGLDGLARRVRDERLNARVG